MKLIVPTKRLNIIILHGSWSPSNIIVRTIIANSYGLSGRDDVTFFTTTIVLGGMYVASIVGSLLLRTVYVIYCAIGLPRVFLSSLSPDS